VERFRPYPVAVLGVVTLSIWVNRIWLAWTNADDTVGQKVVWSVPIVAFVVAAAVLLAMQWQGKAGTLTFVRLVQAFGFATIAYWAIRLPMILLADHVVGFKVVHTVLALALSGAAIAAVRSVSASRVAPGGLSA
jgi:hypothetical protein